MYKAILVLFSFFPLFFVSVVDGDEVSITLNVPDQVELDESVQIDLIFNKGDDVQGFGKFEARFPDGIEVEPVETRGGTFTYSDGVMKILWLSLPQEAQFVLSYTLTAEEGAPEEVQVGGKFSYLIDNEKRSSNILPHRIQVGSGAGVAEEVQEKVPAMAYVSRSIRQTSENQYIIDITVKKQGIEGFSKIEEIVPKGAVVTNESSENAAFSYLRGKVKYVWLGTPLEGDLKVSYNLNLNEASSQDVSSINGEYSYLEDNETRKVDIITSGEPMMAEETAAEVPDDIVIDGVKLAVREATDEEKAEMNSTENETEPETEEVADAQTENDNIEEKSEEEVTQGVQIEEGLIKTFDKAIDAQMLVQQANEEDQVTPSEANPVAANEGDPITSVPNPETGVFYRVQIAAGKNLVDAAYFESRHRYTDQFIVENHAGWVKYVMGNKFDLYRQARDSRNSVNANGHGFDGPFVTAYNSGQRITVQEALMITKQKWYR